MKHSATTLACGLLAVALTSPARAQENDAEKLFRAMEKKFLAAKAFEVKLDYQFAAVLGYKLCPKWTLQAGYRYLFIDYRKNNGVYNMVTTGPLLGVTYTFK